MHEMLVEKRYAIHERAHWVKYRQDKNQNEKRVNKSLALLQLINLYRLKAAAIPNVCAVCVSIVCSDFFRAFIGWRCLSGVEN